MNYYRITTVENTKRATIWAASEQEATRSYRATYRMAASVKLVVRVVAGVN